MSDRLQVRLGGYSPPGTTHARGLDTIASRLREDLGASVEVEIDYNCLDRGQQIEELTAEVEAGELTACYFSTSYLVERIPELGIVDLPFAFDSLAHAHRCLDGELGRILSERTRAATGLEPLGYWDNGMRHLSNKVRPVHAVADCAGLRIRLQPNWAHERYFVELGAEPVLTELRDGIAMLERGEVNAQENPLANFVAYGIERLHPYLTLTGHAYGARAVYAGASQLAAWPGEARAALARGAREAILAQRVEAEAKEAELRVALAGSGTQFVVLEQQARDEFRTAATPVHEEARSRLGDELFLLLEQAR